LYLETLDETSRTEKKERTLYMILGDLKYYRVEKRAQRLQIGNEYDQAWAIG
jgi:hypothetical protein